MMFWLNFLILLLFFPVSFGLLWHSFSLNILSDQLIAFAFFLFSLEQARMAIIDLKSFYLSKKKHLNFKLSFFLVIVISTIMIELFGFYKALYSLGWGAIIVLISQIWFNLLAPLKVIESDDLIVKEYFLRDKIGVLCADIIGLLLMSLWLNKLYPLTIAVIMFAITVSFGIIKYGFSLDSQPE